MERDFLGLSFQNCSPTVKEEAADDSKNSASERGSGMQWSFSNKVSTVPQLLSFKAPQENRPKKTLHDPLGSSALMTISTVDAFDTNQKAFSSAIQKNFIEEKQAGQHYSMTVNQTIPVALSTPVFQSHISSTVKSVVPSTVKAHCFGGLPIIPSVPAIPSNGSIVGTTDLRNAHKFSGASTQLTIFYAGSVSVYDDISPEKAQAIMLLAGNGSSSTPYESVSMAPVETSAPSPSTAHGFFRSWSFSGLPSPISVTTMQSDSQCRGRSNSTMGLAVIKTGASPSSSNHPEPSKLVSSVGPATTTEIPAVAVPQARKATLDRFLEKRKERVISTSPYIVAKKSLDCSAPGSKDMKLSVNPSGSCPLSATN